MKKSLLLFLFIAGVISTYGQGTHTFNFSEGTAGETSADWSMNGATVTNGTPEYAIEEGNPTNIVLKIVVGAGDAAYVGPVTSALSSIQLDATHNVITARYYRSAGTKRVRCRVDKNTDESKTGKVVNGVIVGGAHDGQNATVNGSWQDVSFTFGALAQTTTPWTQLLFQLNFGGGDQTEDITLYIDDIVVPIGGATGLNDKPIVGLKVFASNGQVRLVGDVDVQEVTVYDVTGKKIMEKRGSSIQKVDVPEFTKGIYIIHVKAGNRSSAYKVFKN
ncbi:MAG: T9SS type A sorting domain-containing protein [Marinilabiliaceae bacterium]|nr:T9SS type A sorting domain-containing protein [Marinilabiliaceae bacterium]